MKTETVKIIPLSEVRKEIGDLIMKEGTLMKAAKIVGESHSMLGQAHRGNANPSVKCLDHFGLESRTVYVRKDKSQGK